MYEKLSAREKINISSKTNDLHKYQQYLTTKCKWGKNAIHNSKKYHTYELCGKL